MPENNFHKNLRTSQKERMISMSLLIKDTTKEEREQIIRQSLDCGGGGCENCSSCWLGGGNPFDMYQDYIDGKKEIAEINAEYRSRFVRG